MAINNTKSFGGRANLTFKNLIESPNQTLLFTESLTPEPKFESSSSFSAVEASGQPGVIVSAIITHVHENLIDGKLTSFFVIEVEDSLNNKWEVRRRFTQFHDFHKMLCALEIQSVVRFDFPSKLKAVALSQYEVACSRLVTFNCYLEIVITIAPVPKQVEIFLELSVDPKMRGKLTKFKSSIIGKGSPSLRTRLSSLSLPSTLSSGSPSSSPPPSPSPFSSKVPSISNIFSASSSSSSSATIPTILNIFPTHSPSPSASFSSPSPCPSTSRSDPNTSFFSFIMTTSTIFNSFQLTGLSSARTTKTSRLSSDVEKSISKMKEASEQRKLDFSSKILSAKIDALFQKGVVIAFISFVLFAIFRVGSWKLNFLYQLISSNLGYFESLHRSLRRLFEDINLCFHFAVALFLSYLFAHRFLGFFFTSLLQWLLYDPEKGSFHIGCSWVSIRFGLDHNEIVLADFFWKNPPHHFKNPNFFIAGRLCVHFSLKSLLYAILFNHDIQVYNLELGDVYMDIEKGKHGVGLNLWAALGSDVDQRDLVENDSRKQQNQPLDQKQHEKEPQDLHDNQHIHINAFDDNDDPKKQSDSQNSGDLLTEGYLNGVFNDIPPETDSLQPHILTQLRSLDSNSSLRRKDLVDGSTRIHSLSNLRSALNPSLIYDNISQNISGISHQITSLPSSISQNIPNNISSLPSSISSSLPLPISFPFLPCTNLTSSSPPPAPKKTHWGVPFRFNVQKLMLYNINLNAQDFLTASHSDASSVIHLEVMHMTNKELTQLSPTKNDPTRVKGVYLDDLVLSKLLIRLISDLLLQNSVTMLAIISAATMSQSASALHGVNRFTQTHTHNAIHGVNKFAHQLAQGERPLMKYIQTLTSNGIEGIGGINIRDSMNLNPLIPLTQPITPLSRSISRHSSIYLSVCIIHASSPRLPDNGLIAKSAMCKLLLVNSDQDRFDPPEDSFQHKTTVGLRDKKNDEIIWKERFELGPINGPNFLQHFVVRMYQPSFLASDLYIGTICVPVKDLFSPQKDQDKLDSSSIAADSPRARRSVSSESLPNPRERTGSISVGVVGVDLKDSDTLTNRNDALSSNARGLAFPQHLLVRKFENPCDSMYDLGQLQLSLQLFS